MNMHSVTTCKGMEICGVNKFLRFESFSDMGSLVRTEGIPALAEAGLMPTYFFDCSQPLLILTV
jgi:hypothetical protein